MWCYCYNCDKFFKVDNDDYVENNEGIIECPYCDCEDDIISIEDMDEKELNEKIIEAVQKSDLLDEILDCYND